MYLSLLTIFMEPYILVDGRKCTIQSLHKSMQVVIVHFRRVVKLRALNCTQHISLAASSLILLLLIQLLIQLSKIFFEPHRCLDEEDVPYERCNVHA